jgi:hypothetical protein
MHSYQKIQGQGVMFGDHSALDTVRPDYQSLSHLIRNYDRAPGGNSAGSLSYDIVDSKFINSVLLL